MSTAVNNALVIIAKEIIKNEINYKFVSDKIDIELKIKLKFLEK